MTSVGRLLGSKGTEGCLSVWSSNIARKHCGIVNLYAREGRRILLLTHESDVRQEMKTCLCYEYHQTVKLLRAGDLILVYSIEKVSLQVLQKVPCHSELWVFSPCVGIAT